MTATAVLKFGGDVVAERQRLGAVLEVVAAKVREGWRFVICHGGGPQISALTKRLGMRPNKVGGRRVTDDATLQLVKQVLAGEVNIDVVSAALRAGLAAVGIAGVSCRLVDAHRRPPVVVSGGGAAAVDFGHVGRIDRIRTALIEHLWSGGYVPVVATLGVGADSSVYNINADTVASALAAALGADHLFLMTQVGAVLRDVDDPSSRIRRITADEGRALIDEGTIIGGMIPKVEEALKCLSAPSRVGAVHILGGSAAALDEEIGRPGSSGTLLVP